MQTLNWCRQISASRATQLERSTLRKPCGISVKLYYSGEIGWMVSQTRSVERLQLAETHRVAEGRRCRLWPQRLISISRVEGARGRMRRCQSASCAAAESQQRDTWHNMAYSASPAGGVVALGKFDALHVGHRALAEQASKMGPPWMLSFAGMAEVLGWEPRLPLVAPCDRERVMHLWANHCRGVVPHEVRLEFQKVRSLSPEEFVELLANELQVKGVVAGGNYRFGYKAAGDAADLQRLCRRCHLSVHIVDPVLDTSANGMAAQAENGVGTGYISGGLDVGQVSSTRVRRALQAGDVDRVAELLGRRHRVVVRTSDLARPSEAGNLMTATDTPAEHTDYVIRGGQGGERRPAATSGDVPGVDIDRVRPGRWEHREEVFVPRRALRNEPPKAGTYRGQLFVHNGVEAPGSDGWEEVPLGRAMVEIVSSGIQVVFQNPVESGLVLQQTCMAIEF